MNNIGAARSMCLSLSAFVLVISLGVLITAQPTATSAKPVLRRNTSDYVLLGWNDLGMHCMNESFANLAVLPPFNSGK
jgi:hypothetical protein